MILEGTPTKGITDQFHTTTGACAMTKKVEVKKVGVKIIGTNATPGEVRAHRLAILNAHRKACKEEIGWDCFGGVIRINGLWFQVVSS